MLFESLARRREIGSNSYLLDLGSTRVLLDAGMDPKQEGEESIPLYERVDFDSIDGMIVTHTHLDHCGSLPVAMRHHPGAHVYMTEATGQLVSAMLHNSVSVMTSKREELEIREYPFFTHREVDHLSKKWTYRHPGKPFAIGDDVDVSFFDAGHIMGSIGALLKCKGKTVFYTGDVKFEDQTISLGAEFPREPVDVLILETTKGAASRPDGVNWESEKVRLGQAIRETFEREGSVLIPVFAVGKTQEMLMMIHLLMDEGAIPPCPVFIGGLSTKMTQIVDRFADKVRRQHPDFRILEEMAPAVASRRSKNELRHNPRCIYALSSGMMSEKTVSNRFATGFLDNPRNALLFVGYSDPNSPAGKIREAKKGDPIQLSPDEAPVSLDCDVHSFDFSGHAERDHLRTFANDLQPKKTLLVHGDEDAMQWFHQTLSSDMPDCEVLIPDPGVALPL
ncbi:MAG: MBL fold metallo-hydrolase [Verrucomicrobiota bacterium]